MTKQNNTTNWLPLSRKVPIPENTVDQYESLYQRGDYSAIAELVDGATATKIKRALEAKEGEKEVVDAIIKFYEGAKQLNDLYDYSSE